MVEHCLAEGGRAPWRASLAVHLGKVLDRPKDPDGRIKKKECKSKNLKLMELGKRKYPAPAEEPRLHKPQPLPQRTAYCTDADLESPLS